MKTYTIIGGVNGCGKLSLTGVLKSLEPNMGIIIDPDDIAKKSSLNSYGIGRKTIEKIQKCLSENISFTQETTLAGRYTQKVAKQAQSQNYHIRLYYVGLDTLEESLDRIQNRVKKGGHNIPQEIVSRRYAKRFRSLCRILPYCNEAVLYDNYNGFTEVAQYRNGELIIETPTPPQWISEFQKYLQKIGKRRLYQKKCVSYFMDYTPFFTSLFLIF